MSTTIKHRSIHLAAAAMGLSTPAYRAYLAAETKGKARRQPTPIVTKALAPTPKQTPTEALVKTRKQPFVGSLHAPERETRALPCKGAVKTYILTCAQNNTKVNAACWKNLQALAAYVNAEILVSSFTYATESTASVGQKKTAHKKTAAEPLIPIEVWDDKVVPYLKDSSIQLAPGLVWCGELQILPTAVNPISGLESYTGRDSSIIPHVKLAMQSIASPKFSPTKAVYTTGTVTLRNYIEKKAGQKASFHHSYGGLLVEVCADGTWFVRQLCADADGVIYDLDRRAAQSKITCGHRPEALVWGDIHTRQLEPKMRKLSWGKGGILDILRPKRQVFHDGLDSRAQNHHDRDDPWLVYQKHITKMANVSAEIREYAAFLRQATRPWCESVSAASNHDEATIRWLKEVDFRDDPDNAEFILEATLAAYQAIQRDDLGFYLIEWAVRRELGSTPAIKFLRRDENYVVCDDANGGIELGMHGDKGANGAKGNIRAFSKSGQKCIVADSHSPGIRDGAMQVGVMGALDQTYNQGQSSWSHTNALVYPNGKRCLFTISNGRWRATPWTTAQSRSAR